MKHSYTIAVLMGDGIGTEIVPEAMKVLEAVGRLHGLAFTFKEASVGGGGIRSCRKAVTGGYTCVG